MGKIVRITLTHEVEGSFVISEPEGWKDAVLNWERHPNLHCVPEMYKSAFSSYGSNGVQDGGRDWLKNIEITYGVDAQIDVLVEEAEEMSPFYELSKGTLPIRVFVEVADFDHRLQFTFSPSSFWTTFLSKFETPVDIQSAEDLYGNACSVITPLTVPLTEQKLRVNSNFEQSKIYDYGYNDYLTGPSYNIEIPAYDSTNDKNFITVDLDTIVLDEFELYNPIGNTASVELPNPMWVAKYDSLVDFDFNLAFTLKATVNSVTGLHTAVTLYDQDHLRFRIDEDWMDWFIKIGNNPEIAFAKSFGEATGNGPFTDQYTVFTLNMSSIVVSKGTPIRIYGKTYPGLGGNFGAGDNTVSVNVLQLLLLGIDNDNGLVWPFNPIGGDLQFAQNDFQTHLKIQADTTYQETLSQAFLIHDLGAAIVERITGKPDSFYAPIMGRTNTLARTYPENGCASNNIALRGLQIRGYTVSEKPFSESMEKFWKGVNPIFNFGLRYVKTDTEEYINMAPSREFYPDRVSITLNNVRKITRVYDPSGFYNQIEVGYEKYEIGEASGLDIPQSGRILSSILKTIGIKLEIISSYIAGDLTIEKTRRTTKELSADFEYDNDTFIISVRDTGSGFTPELSENYSSVTGLLNEETRYNKNLTPYRNFVRWLNVASNGLQSYLSSKFKFAKGTGNYDMASTRNDGGCSGDFGGAGLSEKQDIDVSSDYLYLPMLYTIEHYLTSEQIQALRADPEAAINVSQTTTDHVKFYIKTAEVKPFDGSFTLVAWPKTYFDIKVGNITGVETFPNTRIFDSTFGVPFA